MFRIERRVVRACGIVVALVVFALPAPLVAGPAEPHLQFDTQGEAREPFGPAVWLPSGGSMLAKWRTVWLRWNDEKRMLDGCRENRSQCEDPAALEYLAVIDNAKALSGRAQLGEINRAINLAIRPVADLAAHGVPDVWSSPLETLARRSGDCEDYAIAKFFALLEAGLPSGSLRLMVVRDFVRSEDHAVVAARFEDQWLVLDNRRLVMLADSQLAGYSPLLQLDGAGARQVSLASVEQQSGSLPVREPGAIAP